MTRVADFLCPDCGTATLAIVASLELPPDSRSDEITVQAIACVKCGFAGAAAYEESRRGSLDSECWTHEGFRMPAERASALRELLLTCPSPRNGACTCRAHRELGQAADGQWAGLGAWGTTERFALRQAPVGKPSP
jgi:hypothetical protein